MQRVASSQAFVLSRNVTRGLLLNKGLIDARQSTEVVCVCQIGSTSATRIPQSGINGTEIVIGAEHRYVPYLT